MGRFLGQSGGFVGNPANHRRVRLFAVGCCRQVWRLIEPFPAIARCVGFAEGFADGVGAKKRLKKLRDDNRHQYERHGGKPGEDVAVAVVAMVARYTCQPVADEQLIWACRDLWRVDGIGHSPPGGHPVQAALFRDIFGNPFRPVAVAPSWLTSTVVALARQMYETREFSAMPILADALQDAGCENPDVLSHCRGPGPHVRGCWLIDLLTGRK